MTNIRDVARRAGLSTATVSRALTGLEGVTDESRRRVREAVEELGYVPKSPPRRGSLNLNDAVALIVPDLGNAFYSLLAKGMQRRARLQGRVTIVSESGEDTAEEISAAERLVPVTRGVVLASPRSPDDALHRLGARGRIVTVNRETDGISSVSADNYHGLLQSFQHLHACGHRRIAYAGGPLISWSERERRMCLDDLKEEKFMTEIEIVDLGNFEVSSAGGLAAADLAISSRASAVVVFNDHLCVGLLARLEDRGVTVPEDMSVVGFDDVPMAELLSPPLTTVAVPAVAMGERVVELLLNESGDPLVQRVRTPVQLQVRQSTHLKSSKLTL